MGHTAYILVVFFFAVATQWPLTVKGDECIGTVHMPDGISEYQPTHKLTDPTHTATQKKLWRIFFMALPAGKI